MRLHLFEFEDLEWFPEPVRSGATDYLSFLLKTLEFYKPSAKLISELSEKSGNKEISDLCSGGGGPVMQLSQALPEFRFTLSDKFPNVKAWDHITADSCGRINYVEHPVDATAGTSTSPGTKTMFSAIHHFKPDQISEIVAKQTTQNTPLILFDGGNKNILMIGALIIIHPLLTVATAPFLKPFRFSRLFFSWIIPLIPVVTVWDGFVSILRLYKPAQLLKIAKEAAPHYDWQAGYLKSKFGLRIAFLCGYSKSKQRNDPPLPKTG